MNALRHLFRNQVSQVVRVQPAPLSRHLAHSTYNCLPPRMKNAYISPSRIESSSYNLDSFHNHHHHHHIASYNIKFTGYIPQPLNRSLDLISHHIKRPPQMMYVPPVLPLSILGPQGEVKLPKPDPYNITTPSHIPDFSPLKIKTDNNDNNTNKKKRRGHEDEDEDGLDIIYDEDYEYGDLYTPLSKNYWNEFNNEIVPSDPFYLPARDKSVDALSQLAEAAQVYYGLLSKDEAIKRRGPAPPVPYNTSLNLKDLVPRQKRPPIVRIGDKPLASPDKRKSIPKTVGSPVPLSTSSPRHSSSQHVPQEIPITAQKADLDKLPYLYREYYKNAIINAKTTLLATTLDEGENALLRAKALLSDYEEPVTDSDKISTKHLHAIYDIIQTAFDYYTPRSLTEIIYDSIAHIFDIGVVCGGSFLLSAALQTGLNIPSLSEFDNYLWLMTATLSAANMAYTTGLVGALGVRHMWSQQWFQPFPNQFKEWFCHDVLPSAITFYPKLIAHLTENIPRSPVYEMIMAEESVRVREIAREMFFDRAKILENTYTAFRDRRLRREAFERDMLFRDKIRHAALMREIAFSPMAMELEEERTRIVSDLFQKYYERPERRAPYLEFEIGNAIVPTLQDPDEISRLHNDLVKARHDDDVAANKMKASDHFEILRPYYEDMAQLIEGIEQIDDEINTLNIQLKEERDKHDSLHQSLLEAEHDANTELQSSLLGQLELVKLNMEEYAESIGHLELELEEELDTAHQFKFLLEESPGDILQFILDSETYGDGVPDTPFSNNPDVLITKFHPFVRPTFNESMEEIAEDWDRIKDKYMIDDFDVSDPVEEWLEIPGNNDYDHTVTGTVPRFQHDYWDSYGKNNGPSSIDWQAERDTDSLPDSLGATQRHIATGATNMFRHYFYDPEIYRQIFPDVKPTRMTSWGTARERSKNKQLIQAQEERKIYGYENPEFVQKYRYVRGRDGRKVSKEGEPDPETVDLLRQRSLHRARHRFRSQTRTYRRQFRKHHARYRVAFFDEYHKLKSQGLTPDSPYDLLKSAPPFKRQYPAIPDELIKEWPKRLEYVLKRRDRTKALMGVPRIKTHDKEKIRPAVASRGPRNLRRKLKFASAIPSKHTAYFTGTAARHDWSKPGGRRSDPNHLKNVPHSTLPFHKRNLRPDPVVPERTSLYPYSRAFNIDNPTIGQFQQLETQNDISFARPAIE